VRTPAPPDPGASIYGVSRISEYGMIPNVCNDYGAGDGDGLRFDGYPLTAAKGGTGVLVRQFEVGDFNIFSYLVADEEAKEALFIDPSADIDLLLQEAALHDLKVKYVVNTHHHIDHVMGNREMVARTGAKIVIHKDDAAWMLHVEPAMLRMFRAEPSPPADVTVGDGDLVRVGGVALQVIHTPGHTPGGMCLYLEARLDQPGMVFTGDTLFVGSCGRTDFPGGDYEELEKSVRTRLYTLPQDTIVFPGHNYAPRPTSTIEDERLTNAVFHG
jgi:glyoxylase-like metal-dependent hydrolase (beta-lactamase superfamily II)